MFQNWADRVSDDFADHLTRVAFRVRCVLGIRPACIGDRKHAPGSVNRDGSRVRAAAIESQQNVCH